MENFKRLIHLYGEFEMFYEKICCWVKRNWNSRIFWGV